MSIDRIALVGYGEVGRIFAAALARAAGVRSVQAYDVKVANGAWAGDARARGERDGVVVSDDLASAAQEADLVICAVTAAAAEDAAASIAAAMRAGSFVLDVNSASPATKKRSAEHVAARGGRYVEAAVMSAVPPFGLAAPMLLGGPHARTLQPELARLGFEATVGSDAYGTVSAIKLCRSVVVKGMEALAVESLLTARRYGVEKEVLASLAATFPGFDWDRKGNDFWRRVVQHGGRRAEEMREAAVTVSDAGGTPRMATATAELQAWMAALRKAGVFDASAKDAGWRELADAIDAARAQPETATRS